MLRETPLGQESELKMQRQRFSRSRKIWGKLKTHDWGTESLKLHFMRWWLLSETVWVILQVLTMGRIGKMRMMKRQSRASWAKMTNPAGWWAQSQKRGNSACSAFVRSRYSSTKWHNRDGRMQPITFGKEIRSPAHLHWGVQQSFNSKQMLMQRHLYRQRLESFCSALTLSPEYHKCRKGLLDKEVVILG